MRRQRDGLNSSAAGDRKPSTTASILETRYMKQSVRRKLVRISISAVVIAFVGWVYAAAQTRAAPATPAIAFSVNSSADTHDAAPGNNSCADSGGFCSLRAAIEEDNALGSP